MLQYPKVAMRNNLNDLAKLENKSYASERIANIRF